MVIRGLSLKPCSEAHVPLRKAESSKTGSEAQTSSAKVRSFPFQNPISNQLDCTYTRDFPRSLEKLLGWRKPRGMAGPCLGRLAMRRGLHVQRIPTTRRDDWSRAAREIIGVPWKQPAYKRDASQSMVERDTCVHQASQRSRCLGALSHTVRRLLSNTLHVCSQPRHGARCQVQSGCRTGRKRQEDDLLES